ncbi:MAG TPA: hypothetical protein VFG69_03670, partial [Nannocystaceae bacterium]|nr:hypothetical protein [Nannocystaceae bacterium]
MDDRYRLARLLSSEDDRELGSPRIAALVRRWYGFGTRADLVGRVDDGLSPDEHALVLATLDRFVARGVLVSEDRLRESLRRDDARGHEAPLVALVVPTRAGDAGADALAVLRRGIESHLRDRALAGHGHEIAVFDDSAVDRCRAGTGALAPRVRFVGRREKHELATTLSAELGRDESIADALRFAMFGSDDVPFRAGANRNCALLLYAGERFASIDDDGVCRISAIPGARAHLRLSSAPDPTEFWCHGDREALLRATAADRGDLVGLHRQLLGRTVAACVGEVPIGHVDLDDMSPRFTERVLSGRARVAATYLGVAGDSGMASPAFALLQRDASRRRIMAGPDAYARALRGREVVRGVVAPTLVDSGFFMGLAIGLDHGDLL